MLLHFYLNSFCFAFATKQTKCGIEINYVQTSTGFVLAGKLWLIVGSMMTINHFICICCTIQYYAYSIATHVWVFSDTILLLLIVPFLGHSNTRILAVVL